MICVNKISYDVPGKKILQECSVRVLPGSFTAVMGSNGAGKTSLLKIITHEVTHYKGSVTINGMRISQIKSRELARMRAVLPQHTTVNFPFTVEQVVEVGRCPHDTTRHQNAEIIDEVLELTGLQHHRRRIYQTLSGGEQQRVQMARVMCQIWDDKPFSRYLLLDEPTASLDMAQQHTLLNLAQRLLKRNIGILAILHDLNLASLYADRFLFLKGGQTVAYGNACDMLTKENIEETFSCRVKMVFDGHRECPMVFPDHANENFTEQIINSDVYEHIY